MSACCYLDDGSVVFSEVQSYIFYSCNKHVFRSGKHVMYGECNLSVTFPPFLGNENGNFHLLLGDIWSGDPHYFQVEVCLLLKGARPMDLILFYSKKYKQNYYLF